MKIIFMGSPDFAVPCLDMLIKSEDEVCAVFTQPDKARGRRGNQLVPTPVKALALEHGIPVYQPLSLKKGEDAEMSMNVINEIKPDLIVVVAYGKILPLCVLESAVYGCVNVHASLLPRYRGAAPIQWCVLNGEKETGVTTMQMGEGLDTGDMLVTAKTEIGKNETASELHDRLKLMGAEVLKETIAQIKNGTLSPKKQDDSLTNYASMLTKDMCPIDFSLNAEEVHHKICGLSENPCANTYINGKRIKVFHSVVSDITSSKPAGTVVCSEKKLVVACGDGKCVELTEIQADGGKRMPAQSFLLGFRIPDNTVCAASAENNS